MGSIPWVVLHGEVRSYYYNWGTVAITPHFYNPIERPTSIKKFSMIVILLYSSDGVGASKTISSANNKMANFWFDIPLIYNPQLASCNRLTKSIIYILNNKGDMGHPCLSPTLYSNGSLSPYVVRTLHFNF